MEINRLSSPTPPQPPARPQPAPPEEPKPPAGEKDKIQLQGNETPKQLFARLKGLGLDPGRDAAARMKGSLEAGYESLIRFQGEDERVLSLRNTDELADFVALVGGGTASQPVADAFAALKTRAQEGDRFFLKRGEAFLPLEPSAAALVLARGDALTRLGLAGEVDSWTSLPAEIPAGKPERVALGRLLDQASELKCTFELEPEKLDTSIKGRAKAVLAGKPDPVEIRSQLIDALEGNKQILLTLPDDDRKIPLPAGVNGKQLESFISYVKNPDEAQQNFKKSYDELVKKEAIILTRSNSGELKGMLTAASDRSAYLNLAAGQEVVVLQRDGTPLRLSEVPQLAELNSTGTVAGAAVPQFDSSQPSDNLFMVYHVSPFDPVNKGIYDDLVRRMTEVGSSKEIDMVAMHSDLPDKRNLRVDRIQSGQLENLKKLDPETVMSDPKTFENFIYETLLANQSDGKVRLFVGGHGGAEKGLLPDGKHNNAAANHAMSVDDFAGAIHKALDRVEGETGKRPFIENLMLCSCLMGNTSLIDALAETGDVGVLCASPEVMMGSSPNSVIEYLHNPEHSKASGEEFARYLVDTISEAPSAPGGSKETHHADTYGAYRLDKRLARDFQESLDDFFKVCLQNPEQAGAIKRAIAACPTYGVNPFINLMFDVDNRDVVQVAERILADVRVTSPEIKAAAEKVIERGMAQVITQKVSDKYEGRKGPTIYLPIDRYDFDEKMARTNFLSNTDYGKFCEMIFDAPLHRDVKETFLAEAGRLAEALKDAKAEAAKEATEDEETKDKKTEEKDQTRKTPKPGKGVIQEVHGLEAYHGDNVLTKVGRGVRKLITGAAAIVGGLAGAAVGAIPGVLVGAVMGARAGWTGHSAVAQSYGAGDTGEVGPRSLSKLGSLAAQAALFPSEAAGLRTHEAIGFRAGEWPARLVGSLAGLVGGAVGGALGGGAVGAVPGFLLARAVGKMATFWMPGQLPEKDHTQGLDSNLTVP